MIRFEQAMRENIDRCISQINNNPTPENVEAQIRQLSSFLESHIKGLAAEIELVGSAFEKVKSESPGDPDQMSEEISRLQKSNEELELENKNLQIQKQKAESRLRSLEENSRKSEPSKTGKEKELEKLLEHYKKENVRLMNIIDMNQNTEGQESVRSLNERVNALDLELDQVIKAIEDKDAELERMNEMYRSAEFAHAERESNFKRLIERLEKKLAAERLEKKHTATKEKKRIAAEEEAKELGKILPPEELEKYLAANKSQTPTAAAKSENHEPVKKAYPPICGWQVYYNENKDSFYAKRPLYGKLPLNLYVGKNLSSSVISRAIPKIRRQEDKHGLSAIPLSPNDLALEVKGDSP